jgi:multidrug efflux pump subunit AcrA (membrane-fusion protein)
MKNLSKIKTVLIIFFIIIFSIIAARHFVGLHFKKKFSVRPAPGVIVKTVEKSTFYKSIETFGTAIAQDSKTYRIKKKDIKEKLDIEGRFVKVGEVIAVIESDEVSDEKTEQIQVSDESSKSIPEQLVLNDSESVIESQGLFEASKLIDKDIYLFNRKGQ